MPVIERSRNLVASEQATLNRERGGLTFNAMPPEGYIGIVLVFAAVRLGDHAHVEVQSGRWHASSLDPSEGMCSTGMAGRLVLRWHEWVAFRDQLDLSTPHRIAEVERPTRGQLDRYVTSAPDDVGEQVISTR